MYSSDRRDVIPTIRIYTDYETRAGGRAINVYLTAQSNVYARLITPLPLSVSMALKELPRIDHAPRTLLLAEYSLANFRVRDI